MKKNTLKIRKLIEMIEKESGKKVVLKEAASKSMSSKQAIALLEKAASIITKVYDGLITEENSDNGRYDDASYLLNDMLDNIDRVIEEVSEGGLDDDDY